LVVGHAEVLLNVVNYFASAGMNNPEANVRSGKPMSLQQLPECRFDHGTGEMLDRCSKHDSQLAISMLKSNFFDLLCIEESLEIDNFRISAICFLAFT